MASGVLLLVLEGAGAACDRKCDESQFNAYVSIDVPDDHASEACVLTLTSGEQVATYGLPPAQKGTEVPCSVGGGPPTSGCSRSEFANCLPDNQGVCLIDASAVVVDEFSVGFTGRRAYDARAYFGSDVFDVTLTCGSKVLARQQAQFMCPIPM